MREAAAEERFEEAARYRNRLFAIGNLAERQAADRREVGSVDVIGLAVDGDHAAVQVFPLRDGKLIDRYAFHLENVEGQDAATILEAFCLEYYGRAGDAAADHRAARRDGARGARGVPLASCAARASRCGRPRAARSGGSPSWPRENARLALESEAARPEHEARCAGSQALEELREALNLESLPVRIECFDISNIQGREIVGSMSVFVDGAPKKAHYRTFAMRGVEGQDDFAAMAEVVSRRFARLATRRRRGVRRELRDACRTSS